MLIQLFFRKKYIRIFGFIFFLFAIFYCVTCYNLWQVDQIDIDNLKDILDNETCEFTNIQSIEKFLDNRSMTTVGEEHIWINKDLSEEKPCYIVPISIESQDYAVVIILTSLMQMKRTYFISLVVFVIHCIS